MSIIAIFGGTGYAGSAIRPDQFKTEASSATAVLDALQADATGADWFYVSPAAAFGEIHK